MLYNLISLGQTEDLRFQTFPIFDSIIEFPFSSKFYLKFCFMPKC